MVIKIPAERCLDDFEEITVDGKRKIILSEEQRNILLKEYNKDDFNSISDFLKLFKEDYKDFITIWNKKRIENKPVNDKNLYQFIIKNYFPDFLISNIDENISRNFKPKNPNNSGLPNFLYSCVYHEGFNCPSNDFYIVYLFNKNLSKVYLTLELGSKNKYNFHYLKPFENVENLADVKNIFKQKIEEYKFILSSELGVDITKFNDDIFLGRIENDSEKNNKAEDYENGTIFAKAYEIDNLPSDEELLKDFNDLIAVYDFILSEFGNIQFQDEIKHNLIYFGAPGTGKSYQLDLDKQVLINNELNYERVTFHPSFSYGNFVGMYKPISKKDNVLSYENSISYEYVPGPFMSLLVKALKNPNENYLLIIEEINRANVADVFGEVFQLLDRDKSNESRYKINISPELRDFLEDSDLNNIDKLYLPSNFYIWATMNSADQGVFPLDTAFKRRWDFKYFDIDKNSYLRDNLKVNFAGSEYYWNDIRKAINDELLSYKINEDKLLGPFFAFNEYDDEIPPIDFIKIFKNKIIMYLFEDVAKSRRNDLFSGSKRDKSYVTYSQICDDFDDPDFGFKIFHSNIYSKINGD